MKKFFNLGARSIKVSDIWKDLGNMSEDRCTYWIPMYMYSTIQYKSMIYFFLCFSGFKQSKTSGSGCNHASCKLTFGKYFNFMKKLDLSYQIIIRIVIHVQWCSQNAEKIRTSKGDYCIKQWFSTITSLFKMGTSLKEKNFLPEGVNSFR